MSQENVEIVRREYATFVTRDWEALAKLCLPDLEYETWGPPGQLRGFREMIAYFDEWASVFGEFRVGPRRSLKSEIRWWPSSGRTHVG